MISDGRILEIPVSVNLDLIVFAAVQFLFTAYYIIFSSVHC